MRFNTERKILSEIPVTFVEKQKQATLQRKTPIRQLVYSSHTQSNSSEQPTYASLNYKAPLGTIANLIKTVSSEFGNIEYEMLSEQDLSYSDFPRPANISIIKSQKLPRWGPAKAKMFNSDGHKLISQGLLEPTLKNEHFAVDFDNMLQSFFGSVRKKIESHKKYPRFAKNSGIEGRSGVKITILKSGQLEKVEVVDSSGSEILDNAAMQSIREASPFPPIPMGLRQNRIELSIYLVFKMAKT